MTFLELLRLRRGLSKAETARLVRMLLTDYTLVERGLQRPSEAAANRLKAAFGYGPELLVADVFRIVEDSLQARETDCAHVEGAL
jgi:transcriptional regulator with XRE-family HTH domain